ncbi:MAG TPA: sugar porter family MFS transporter [Acidobacteriaceae bacterium]|nr:sugar porter family MFS transporter [Acidobacteriaceae bacterium]
MPHSQSLNRHLLFTAVIASLGGLLFGFDTAVIAGTTRNLTAAFHLTPATLGITVSSALWGTVVGAAFSGALGDRFGRRRCLQGLALVYFFSAMGCVGAWSWSSLVTFRVLSGLAIGSSSVLSPTYIAEIAPRRLRGRLVAMFQFNVVFGILLAYLSNYCVGLFNFGADEWRWKFGVAALPAILFLISLVRIPESPRWLVGAGDVDGARGVLERMGDTDADLEIEQMIAAVRGAGTSAGERLFQWRYKLPIFLAITIGFFNQVSGVNAILYYLNSIFEAAGFSRVSSDLQAVLIGLTNLAAVTAAMFCIDRMGRRPLLLIGSVGAAVCLGGVAVIFQIHRHQNLLVWCLVGFIGFFSFSQGAVIWVYISEVFPNLVRAKGLSLGSFTHWIMNAIVSAIFPLVAARWGAAPFYFFASMMALQFVIVMMTYPETRGIALEEMETKLGHA